MQGNIKSELGLWILYDCFKAKICATIEESINLDYSRVEIAVDARRGP